MHYNLQLYIGVKHQESEMWWAENKIGRNAITAGK